jgi:PAS domain S-box-containing protein
MPLSPRHISLGLLITVLLLGTSAIASNFNLKKLSKSRESIEHTYQVIDSLRTIRETVKDTERFRRGYLLTNNIQYFNQIEPSISKIYQSLENFRVLTQDNPIQQERMRQLSDLINIRLYIWQKSLEEFADREKNISLLEKVDLEQIEATEKGTKISNEIINLIATAKQTELALLQIQKHQIDTGVQNTALFSNLVYGLGLLSLISVYWLLLQEISQRRVAQDLLDQSNTNLARLVQEKTISLKKEQAQLAEAQQIGHIGSFEYDIINQQNIWSEETYRILKYNPNLPEPTHQEIIARIYPDDVNKYITVFRQLSQLPLDFDLDYRFCCEDGTVKYINSRGKSVANSAGEIEAIIGVLIDVTERKNIELKLQEQAKRLQLIIEGCQMGTWDWELATNQLTWSPRHFEILGLVYCGQEQGDYQTWEKHLHPDDRQAALEIYDQRLQDGQIYQNEYRIIRADNQQVRWIGALGSFIFDKTGKVIRSIGVIFDVTERKESEIALQNAYAKIAKNEQRYRSLIEATSQAVWFTDGQGLAQAEAPSWQKLTGQTTAEILGFGWLNAIHPDDQARVRSAWQQAQIGPTVFDCEYRLRNAQGIYGYYHSKGIPLLNEQNQLDEWVGVATDITQIKLAEAILKNTNTILETKVMERTQALEQEIVERLEIEKQLREITVELERSNHELSQFAYIASHDLQEPLRAIINFAEKISTNYRGRLDAKADMYIEFVVDGANRMQNLVRDLLAYSRVGRKDLTWQPVDLNNLLIKVCHDLQIAIKETAADINIATLPLIYGDRSQLGLLWQNLLSNSLKYHSDRPVKIEILLINEDLPPDPELLLESYVLLAIKDNGIGIDSQYNERIFGIFQRLHSSEEYPGTGLGLAICQKIVERHHGKIWLESVLGEGSTFYLVLPKADKI